MLVTNINKSTTNTLRISICNDFTIKKIALPSIKTSIFLVWENIENRARYYGPYISGSILT